jgi:hypothetical protein
MELREKGSSSTGDISVIVLHNNAGKTRCSAVGTMIKYRLKQQLRLAALQLVGLHKQGLRASRQVRAVIQTGFFPTHCQAEDRHCYGGMDKERSSTGTG